MSRFISGLRRVRVLFLFLFLLSSFVVLACSVRGEIGSLEEER